jgi:Rrf2 family protein
MKLTHRTDYAIHLIADLSEDMNRPLGLRALAERHGVTYAFARTVQQGLLKAGIVVTARGINGGLKLARPLQEITLLEVFEAAQDPLDKAFSARDCCWRNRKNSCVSDDLWLSTRKMLGQHLAGIQLNHIIKIK